MKKRGKIVRDPRTGPGLLMAEGRQYRFGMEDFCHSEVPPAPGVTVQLRLDRAGQILAITAASEPKPQKVEGSGDTPKAAAFKVLRTIAAKCGLPHLLRR